MADKSQHNSRSGKEFILANKARDLLTHTLRVTSNKDCYPNWAKYSLVVRIQNTALDIVENVVLANELMHTDEIARRVEYQAKALSSCKLLMILVDVSLACNFINIKRAEYWTKIAAEVKTMLTAWRKKDTSRMA